MENVDLKCLACINRNMTYSNFNTKQHNQYKPANIFGGLVSIRPLNGSDTLIEWSVC